jgi:MFS family permease
MKDTQDHTKAPAQQGIGLERLLIVGGVVAFAHAAMMIVIPSVPAYVDQLGGTAIMVGLTFAAYSLARLIMNIPAGVMSERFGRKRVLVAGALGVGLFATLSGLAPNMPLFLFYRFLTGVFSAMAITSGSVVATDLSTIANRGRVLSLIHGWHLILGIASPALGGVLADAFGNRVPFLASGVGVAALGIWALLRLPETKPIQEKTARQEEAPPEESTVRSAIGMLREPSFLLVALVGFLQFFTRAGAGHSLIPLMAFQVLEMSPGQLGLMFSVAAILHGGVLYPAGWVADKFGRKAVIVPAGIGAAVGLAMLPFSSTVPVFVMAFLVLQSSTGFGGQAPVAYVGDMAPPKLRGLSFGVWRTFGDLAGVIAPLVMTGLVQVFSFHVGFFFNVGLALVVTLLFARFAVESTKRTAGAAAH